MLRKVFTFLFLVCVFGLFAVSTNAQADASTPWGKPKPEEPLPKNVRETLKKSELEQQKKEYDEMLENGQEAVKLSEEVENSFNKNKKLSSTDVEKLEKIEKLLKKIRKELGGDGDVEVEEKKAEKPSTIGNAIETLKDSAISLYDELKKTSRYSISVIAIQSSNSLINIVRFIRFWKK